MSNKMLIDSSHPEETRVVVVKGNRLEDFDFESQHKRQIRGNIYLAKVTRVEPSLQAAFVDYGGNRHGFLAFSEIHPDYYQIPLADRQALLEEEAALADAEEADDDAEAEARSQGGNRNRGRKSRGDDRNNRGRNRRGRGNNTPNNSNVPAAELVNFEAILAAYEAKLPQADEATSIAALVDGAETIAEDIDIDDNDDEDADDDAPEEADIVADSDDAIEDTRPRRRSSRRQYKIQEVIKRRQVILVQVVKEERGNKGAALTTYMSLAGRYSVLMPNTARGGGISRKITNIADRKRLKDMVKDLEVPKGMGVILRTAGANRTRGEVKRDYEYLMRLWDNVRDLTLSSSAPTLVYEEGSLIKRSIRDLFTKEISEVIVAGEAGFREAKEFMRMLMPGSAKQVKPWLENSPIFARTGMEAQLDRLMTPQVTLKSGGYLIINQTEALVAIDVNSGKSTREHSVEETAIATNLEAAEEVARQLRLRDLAGLIVIDFIDMEENRNNRAVEKKLKDCLKNDRARIQVGRISHFGLMEMSRQRMRASVLESTMQVCPHCEGTGLVRSSQSVALHVIRSIEDYLIRNDKNHITVRTPVATALYILNDKRESLVDMEQRFGLNITIAVDETVGADMLAIDRGEISDLPKRAPTHITIDYDDSEDDNYIEIVEDGDDEIIIQNAIGDEDSSISEVEAAPAPEAAEERGGRNKRRRRRGKGRDRDNDNGDQAEAQSANAQEETNNNDNDNDDSEGEGRGKRRRRSRGRRGGRNRRNTNVRTPNAELVGPMVELAAAWDAEHGNQSSDNSSEASANNEQNSSRNDDDSNNGGKSNSRNRRRRGRSRNGTNQEASATQETSNDQQNANNGDSEQPPKAPEAKPDAQSQPVAAVAKAETVAAEPAKPASTPEEKPIVVEAEKPQRVRATQSNINLEAEPVVVSDKGNKPAEKKGGWWSRVISSK